MHAADEHPPIVRLPGGPPAWDLPHPLHKPQEALSAVLRALVGMSGLGHEEWAQRAREAPGMGYVTSSLVDHWTAEPARVMAGGEVLIFALGLVGMPGLGVLAAMLSTD